MHERLAATGSMPDGAGKWEIEHMVLRAKGEQGRLYQAGPFGYSAARNGTGALKGTSNLGEKAPPNDLGRRRNLLKGGEKKLKR